MSETILITSFLEPQLVERIRASWTGEVLFEPRLLPEPQFVADHVGRPPLLNPAAQAEWASLLGRAEICFDFDWWQPERLFENSPRLKWLQASSAGIGAYVSRFALDRADVVFTTAAGTHAGPLTEFAVTGALFLIKGVPDLLDRQRRHHWERYTSQPLFGRRVTVVGLGRVGRHVASTFTALGTEVTGLGRPGGNRYDVPGVRIADTDALDSVLPTTDVLVVATPLTPDTTGLITRARLNALPAGCVIVNIARGPVIDNAALLDVLRDGLPGGGRLGGAALDVTDPEPLPPESPLWDRSDVLISPHSASTVAGENATLVELFIDNLSRWRDGRPLINQYHPELGY